MYVSRIELFGFKSFMERTVLPLGRGVTGVVGPNGCGKSNVVDAIRWVLGETRARSLRGELLEDVIFNGTDKLRPLGLAEISLTLKAEDNFFSELVSPALEAEIIAEGAYLEEIAPTTVEAVETEQGFREANQDTEVTSDRRPNLVVLDGTGSAPTPAPVANSASFEHKFTWLKSASEVEITRRLYRSGESEFFINRVPCRLRDMKDLCRAAGLTASGYTVVAQGEISRLITSKPEQRRAMLEEAAGVQGFRDKIAAATRRLDETSQNLVRLVDIVNEVTRQVASLKRQAARARSRQEIKDQVTQLDRIVFQHKQLSFSQRQSEAEQEVEQLRSDEQELTTSLKHKKLEEDQLRSELMQVDLEGDELRQNIDICRQKINVRRQELLKREAELNQVKSQIEYRQSEIGRIQDQIKTIGQRQEAVDQRLAALVQEELEYTNKISAFDADSSSEKLNALSQEISALRDRLRNEDREWRELRDKMVAIKSRVEVLEQQLVSASPAGQIEQTLKSAGLADSFGKLSVLADGLIVPQEYSKPVQAVLENRAAYLVAQNPAELGAAFQQNRGNKKTGIGIFKLLPTESSEIINGSVLIAASKSNESLINLGAQALLSLIQIKPGFELVAQKLFANTYLVADSDKASQYFAKFPDDLETVLLAPTGEVLSAWSFCFFNQEGGLIESQAKLRSFKEDQIQINADYEAKTQNREVLTENLKEQERVYAQLLNESQSRQRELRNLGGALGQIKGKLEAERRQQRQCQEDGLRLEHQTTQAEIFISEKVGQLAEREAAVTELNCTEDHGVQEQLKEAEAAYSQLEVRRKQRRALLGEANSQVESCRSELDHVRALASDLNLKLQRISMEQQDLLDKLCLAYGNEIVEDWSKDLSSEKLLAEADFRENWDQLNKLKSRIVREGEVDPESIEHYDQEQARLDELVKQREDLEQASAALKESLARLIKTSEQRFVETFEQVKVNFANLIPQLFGGGKGELELSNSDKPLDAGLEIIVRPPGKKPKNLELLSGGEKALCATALIMSMFMVRPSPLCILDEVDAPLDEANLLRFLDVIKSMSGNTQFMLITHNKQSMAAADHLWGVTMEQPGATRILSVSLQEAYKQVA